MKQKMLDTEKIMEVINLWMGDYSYILILLATIFCTLGVVLLILKNKPSQGKITDVYNSSGQKQEKKGYILTNILIVIGILFLIIFLIWNLCIYDSL